MNDDFRVEYRNPHLVAPTPDLYEDYDVISAFYDYEPAGPALTLHVCEYTLEFDGRLLIDWIRSSLRLAVRIHANAPDDWAGLRESLPELPAGTHVYFWIASDIAYQPPVLVFAVDGERVLIYTRSSASVGGPKLLVLEGDREAPCIVRRQAVLEAITSCITLYLDDLVAAFPFLLDDEMYQAQRETIASLLR